ncbi:MAG: sterol desaturase family protein, partial [Limisphaerales bacterium]
MLAPFAVIFFNERASDSLRELARFKTASGLILLALLLLWETLSPYFIFTKGKVLHAARNLFLGIINTVLTTLVFIGLWFIAARWAQKNQFGLLNWIELPRAAHVFCAILLLDFWMYWWHWMNHRLPFFWRFHRTHHSDPKMDVTTASRFHFGEIFFSSCLRIPLIALLGVQLWDLVFYEMLLSGIVQFHHANIGLTDRADLILRCFIVTPFIHKVHHSRVQPETDSNYSSLFSFWDRIFRSLRLREDPRTLQYGLENFDEPKKQTLFGLLKT